MFLPLARQPNNWMASIPPKAFPLKGPTSSMWSWMFFVKTGLVGVHSRNSWSQIQDISFMKFLPMRIKSSLTLCNFFRSPSITRNIFVANPLTHCNVEYLEVCFWWENKTTSNCLTRILWMMRRWWLYMVVWAPSPAWPGCQIVLTGVSVSQAFWHE